MSDDGIVSDVDPIYVSTVGDLVRVVTDICAGGHILWYRGHASASWDVCPSIWRGYSAAEERNLTNRFRSRAAIRYSPAPGYDARTSWLSLMQHYGLPTRLLDWTRSPLVAAYFALERYLPGEGTAASGEAAIWMLWPHQLNVSQGFPPITPSIDAYDCRRMVSPAFTDSVAENGKVLAAMAAETDMRMFVQQGCFTIHSSQLALNKMHGHAAFLRPIVIKAGAVHLMAREISACGFRQGDLYPDLGNLAEELKRTYPAGSIPSSASPMPW